MPLIITPGQFTHRAELYHQLAQLTQAGVTLLQSLETLHRQPPTRSFRPRLRNMVIQLTQGNTFSESLRAEAWLPEFDVALIEAGERSGRLDACFRLLADYYTDRARVARGVIADLLYPAALLHFAVFILPFADFFTTGIITKNTPDLGEAREEVEVDYKGGELAIGFNPTFLIDVLKNVVDENIKFGFIDPEKPAVIKSGDDYTYIVLPMQVS